METPKYLLTFRFMIQTVVFIVLFSIFFMVLYQPSSATAWFGFSSIPRAAATLGYYLADIAVFVISKFLLYQIQRKHSITVLLYVLWIVGEIITVSILYILFAIYVAPDAQSFSMRLLINAFTCVPPILVIPYAIMTLWASNLARKEEFEMLRLNYKATMRGLDPQLLHLYDFKGELKMSVRSSAIYYIAAQDNYVQIIYDMDNEMCSYLLRCSTQKLEKMLEGTSLVRCHRSFIVNVDHVKFFRNEREGTALLLDSPDSKLLPVSKTYYKQTLSKIEERGSATFV